jgi:predicted metal-dependent phosphoesterase TrpH
MRTDLHIHTVATDGRWTPERVIVEVQAREIGLFAVTDHDSVDSVRQAETLAREAGLAFLRGVEVSTRMNGHIFHILAYGVDLEHETLVALMRENRAALQQTNDAAIRRLIAAGYAIDWNDYAAYEYDRTRGGWKAFNFLIDRGFCSDLPDYFRTLSAHGANGIPAYARSERAIAIIRGAGGVPILAHPGGSLSHVGITDEALHSFLDLGIAGLECYSNYHDDATTRSCLDWCSRYDRLATGGSDCHGGFVERELGVPAVDTADLRLGELEEHIVR